MKNFLAFFNVFPMIIQVVQAVESAIPIPKAGKQKMDMVLGAASTAWEMTQAEPQITKNTTLSAIQAMANLAVAGLNVTGVFKSSPPVSSK